MLYLGAAMGLEVAPYRDCDGQCMAMSQALDPRQVYPVVDIAGREG